jgi:hypothetical protein
VSEQLKALAESVSTRLQCKEVPPDLASPALVEKVLVELVLMEIEDIRENGPDDAQGPIHILTEEVNRHD